MDDIGRIYPPKEDGAEVAQKIEVETAEQAKKIIEKADRQWLMAFVYDCYKAGLIRVLSGTDHDTTEALRRRAFAAIDNLHEECVAEEAKTKVIL